MNISDFVKYKPKDISDMFECKPVLARSANMGYSLYDPDGFGVMDLKLSDCLMGVKSFVIYTPESDKAKILAVYFDGAYIPPGELQVSQYLSVFRNILADSPAIDITPDITRAIQMIDKTAEDRVKEYNELQKHIGSLVHR